MIKNYVNTFIALSIFLVSPASGQFTTWEWASALSSSNDEKGWDVAWDKTANCVYVGGSFEGGLSTALGPTFANSFGGKDGLVVKYTSAGSMVWAFKVGGTLDDEIKSIVTDPFGNIYVSGYFRGTVDFDPSTSSYTLSANQSSQDGFIAKYSPSGNIMWATKFGGNGTDDVWKVYADSNAVYLSGSYIGSATFYSTSSVTKSTIASQGNNNFFGAKYDLNGVVQWVLTAGSSANDEGLDVLADKNKVFFTGSYERDLTIYSGGGSSTQSLTVRTQDKSDVFIIACNQSGNIVWATNAASQDVDEGHGIAQDENNIYITGSYNNNTIAFPYPSSVITRTNSGNTDIFIACLSKNNGTYQWASSQTGSGNGDEESYEIDVAPNGNIIVTGYFKSTLSFSQFGGTNLSSNGNEDIFLACYDNTGNYVWSRQAGSTSSDFPHGISITAAGEIYLAGQYANSIIFQNSTLPAASGINMFVAKTGCSNISNNSINQTQPVCAGSSATLAATTPTGGATGTYTYTWEQSTDLLNWNVSQTFTSAASYTTGPLTSSTYFRRIVSAAQSCGTSTSNTIHVAVDSVSPPANAGDNFSVCSPSFVINSPVPMYGTASWSVMSGNVSLTAPANNTMLVTGLTNSVVLRLITKNGVCPANTSDIAVNRDADPSTANAGPDLQVLYSEANLNATPPAIGHGSWSTVEGYGQISDPNSPATQVSGLSDGNNVFRWTVRNGSCPVSTDDVTINVQEIQIPNAISPNNDGLNDSFTIPSLEKFNNVQLTIFNRWGGLVYKSDDYKNTWAGFNLKNERLSDDTYYYALDIPSRKTFTGYVILKREK